LKNKLTKSEENLAKELSRKFSKSALRVLRPQVVVFTSAALVGVCLLTAFNLLLDIYAGNAPQISISLSVTLKLPAILLILVVFLLYSYGLYQGKNYVKWFFVLSVISCKVYEQFFFDSAAWVSYLLSSFLFCAILLFTPRCHEFFSKGRLLFA